jgi:hypothetical protein
MVELQPVVFQEIGEEVGWWHAKTPLHMRFEHQNLGRVWGRYQGFMVSLPVGFCPWSHGTLVLQSLDMSIFDMAFYLVPVKVHGNLLFLT